MAPRDYTHFAPIVSTAPKEVAGIEADFVPPDYQNPLPGWMAYILVKRYGPLVFTYEELQDAADSFGVVTLMEKHPTEERLGKVYAMAVSRPDDAEKLAAELLELAKSAPKEGENHA